MKIEDYSYFTLSYSVYLLILTIYNSIIIEPFSIYFLDIVTEKNYLIYHISLTIWFVTITLLIILISQSFSVLEYIPLSIFGIFSMFSLIDSLFRRNYYLLKKSNILFLISLLRLVVIMAFLFLYIVFKQEYYLSVYNTFIMWSIGILTILLIYLHTSSAKINLEYFKLHLVIHIIKRYLSYGKWALALSILVWSTSQGPFFGLEAFSRIEDIAGLKGILTILGPINLIATSVGVFYIPYISELINNKQQLHRFLSNKIINYTLIVAIILLLFFYLRGILFESFFPDEIVRYNNFFPFFLFPTLLSINLVFKTTFLKLVNKINKVFYSYLTSFIISSVISVLFIGEYGIIGVILFTNLNAIIANIVIQYHYLR